MRNWIYAGIVIFLFLWGVLGLGEDLKKRYGRLDIHIRMKRYTVKVWKDILSFDPNVMSYNDADTAEITLAKKADRNALREAIFETVREHPGIRTIKIKGLKRKLENRDIHPFYDIKFVEEN